MPDATAKRLSEELADLNPAVFPQDVPMQMKLIEDRKAFMDRNIDTIIAALRLMEAREEAINETVPRKAVTQTFRERGKKPDDASR